MVITSRVSLFFSPPCSGSGMEHVCTGPAKRNIRGTDNFGVMFRACLACNAVVLTAERIVLSSKPSSDCSSLGEKPSREPITSGPE